MENYWWCAILFRIILPLAISVAVFIRPTITSYVYLVMGCYMPFFSVPTAVTMARRTGTYMKILVITCILTTTLVTSFYFTLYFPTEREYDLDPCTTLEIAMRTVGVIEFEGLEFQNAIPWYLPEPLMLGTSIILYLCFKKLCQDTAIKRATIEMEGREFATETNRKKILSMMLNVGKYFVVFMCCLTAVLKANLLGAIYYFVFLVVMTYWACNQTLGKVFARILACLIPIAFFHITIVFWYQFQYFQDSDEFDPQSIWGRLFHLVDIKTYKDCRDPRIFKFHAQSNVTYALPICLFFFYQLTVLVSRKILMAQDGFSALVIAVFQPEALLPRTTVKWRRALAKLQQNLDDEKSAKTSAMMDKIKLVVEQTLDYIMSISYLAANFVMMIWAIIFVGWKTMILLIWANLIWLMPFRKKVMLTTSPFLVAWVWFLLGVSYLYSMDLTPEELPPKVGIINFQSGVEPTSEFKWVHQLTKSLFGIVIFVTMRQLWQERAMKKQERQLAEAVGLSESGAVENLAADQHKNKFLEKLQSSIINFFAIWWIWVVIITMIWMDFWSTSNVFRIVFVGLAILFVMTFQLCPFKYWKVFLRMYWWIVIIYAMINLFVVYMYQISITRNLMHQYVAEKYFRRYGFQVWTDRRERSFALANPLFFQIAIVVQQNYLQKEFEKLTSPTPPEELALQGQKLKESGPRWRKVKVTFINAKNIIFGILEVHMQNIVLIVGWLMCVYDLCALFVPFVLLFTASCVFGRMFRSITTYFVSCLVQILILLRLVYMNQYLDHSKWNYVGHYIRNGQPFNKTLNSADWLGFHESRLGRDYADFGHVSWCFLYVFMVTVMRVVSIRMKNYRLSRGLGTMQYRVLFPEITYENCHQSTNTVLKFLVNFGYYKFGYEITAVFASIVMGLRMDMVAIMLSVWLLMTFALNRTWLRIIWLPTLVLSAIAVPVQYLASLGSWPTRWEQTHTRFWSSNDFLLRVQQFCHLPNMAHPPIKEKISYDFWLLLLMSRQWSAFRREWKYKGQYYAGGQNENVSNVIDEDDIENPVPDFVTYTRSYLDIFKNIFFTAWFYMALTFTFLAGTMRPTLYSFGYILGALIFVWEGTDLFLRPPSSILWRWNLLIGYTILVMMTRTMSQIFGCILKYETHIYINCAVYKMFTIGCVDKFAMTAGVPNLSKETSCQVDYDALGLGFDCVCFFFLIFQQRVFKSYHFFHIVNDTKAQTILADRGAELIEEQNRKTREALDAEDAIIRDNIKKKMDKIRANHQKVQGEVYSRRKKNHKHMLKSSDYYMFDDASLLNDIPLLPVKQEEDDTEIDPYDPMTLTEYFALLYTSNISTVLAARTLRRQQKSAIQEGKKPEDVKKALTTKDSKPGTSKDPNPEVGLSKSRKTLNFVLFLWGALESLIVSITGLINRRTKDFRSILNDIKRKNIILKEKTNYARGVRLGANKIWHPVESYKDILRAEKDKRGDTHVIAHSIYVKLLMATWYWLVSHSEWLCYFVIILNQVIRNDFISLPLMIIMFSWGALTVPKPTKTFWIITIAYVLIMMCVKHFCAMGFAPWHKDWLRHEANLFYAPDFMGLSAHTSVTFDLLMLATFFFHRVVLQRLGLWKPFTYRRATLLEDGDYIFKDGKLIPMTKDNTGKNQLPLAVTSVGVSKGDYFPKSIVHGAGTYAGGFRVFIQQLISPTSTQNPVDVYTPMFLCDMINILLIMFYFGCFVDEELDDGFIEFIQNNRVPIGFLVILLVYFFLMVVDRALYLQKNRYGKLVYHFFQVMFCHIWFFVLYPMITHRRLNETTVAQVFFVLKCLYFLFSAYQIRNGYPPLISCHCLWHGTSVLNRFGYKFYRLIPYFFEMRTLLDWICSDTCLGVNDWFKMEEITQNIFDQRCEQELDKKWGGPSGQPKKRGKKYIFGGILYLLLVLTVIYPFLIFSLGETVGVTTHPAKIKIELYMGSAEPIFQSYASEKNLRTLTQDEYKNLTGTFNNIRESEDIFGSFQPEDVVVVTWSPHSLTKWKVSPGTFLELMDDLHSNDPFAFRFEIHYIHIGHGGERVQKTFGQNSIISPLPDEHRKNLIDMLEANQSLEMMAWLPMVFPKFLMITKESEPLPLLIMEGSSGPETEEVSHDPRIFRNLLVSLQHSDDGDKWWYMQEECSLDDDNYFYYLKDLVHNRCETLVMYTFNEKVFSHAMTYLTRSGILGLYLLYFMMVIGIIRGCRIEIGEIWIEDLPDSDDMMRKCLEVYVARDMDNYELEEELFSQLIFIMRSREILIKLTRYKDSPYNPPTLKPK